MNTIEPLVLSNPHVTCVSIIYRVFLDIDNHEYGSNDSEIINSPKHSASKLLFLKLNIDIFQDYILFYILKAVISLVILNTRWTIYSYKVKNMNMIFTKASLLCVSSNTAVNVIENNQTMSIYNFESSLLNSIYN